MLVTPRGDIRSPFWIILLSPSEQDEGAGTLITGSEGFHFDKIVSEIGLPPPYITCLENNSVLPNTTRTGDKLQDGLFNFLSWTSTLDVRPQVIGLYGSPACEVLCPETKNYKKPYDTKLDKWAGSLLVSPLLNWPHYCVPLWTVQDSFFPDWSYRDIYKFIDLGHLKDEYDYWTSHGSLNPLPVYNINSSPTFSEICDWFDYCRNATYISSDIENVKPPKALANSDRIAYIWHLYTIALAPNPREAVAFQLWNWPSRERLKIWQGLNELLKRVPIIGQNYFQHDAHYEEAYGLEPNIDQIHDTRIRHHVLWPELSHTLQFMTRQYTRQKFYKDEGKNFKPKELKKLLNYNGMDSCIEFEVFECQEKEFDERPHLR